MLDRFEEAEEKVIDPAKRQPEHHRNAKNQKRQLPGGFAIGPGDFLDFRAGITNDRPDAL